MESRSKNDFQNTMGRPQMLFPWPTVGGYDFYEVLSALQKSIRRGFEADAVFWATELYLSGYENQAWDRFHVIASEDVGLAYPEMVADIQALHNDWKTRRRDGDGRLFFTQAVLLLVRAPKSRIVDHALMVYFEGPREKKPIPDYALDKHTSRGRRLGRGHSHFFAEGAVLNSKTLDDPYEEEARKIRHD